VTKTPAVQVSKQEADGTLTTSGCIGAGTAYSSSSDGSGVGLGVLGHGATSQYGPEFTITFSTNPGILKTIELDTRQVTNPGTTDYWVANSRQGQFQSRYSTNLGRINTLRYGSKLLYTNTDLSAGSPATVSASTPLKVGGQEFGVVSATSYVITLNEPFLGTSIIPVLTDTGSKATALKTNALEMVTSAGGKITALTVGDFKTGAKLYVNGCPVTSTDTTPVAPNQLTVDVNANNDCHYDAFPGTTSGDVVYRRTDDPNNQNVYATSGDSAAVSAQGYCTTRGSADIYSCAQTGSGVVTGFAKANNIFTVSAATGGADDDTFFVNGLGPMRVTSGIAGTAITASFDGESGDEFFESFDDATDAGMLMFAATAATDRAAGDILIMDGRRYKVASVGNTPSGVAAKITLTETYAGGMIYEECTSCVTEISATAITSSRTITTAIGEGFMVEGYTNINQVFSAKSANSPASTTLTISKGAKNGYPLDHPGIASGLTKTLYRVLNGMGYKPYEVTEAVGGTTYQYVSQCSNRGACDSSTGVCKCFKGYSNDNCDTQNMLAA